MSIQPFSSEQQRIEFDQRSAQTKATRFPAANWRQGWIYAAIYMFLVAVACLSAHTASGQEKQYLKVPMNPPAMAEEKNAKRVVAAAKSFASGGAEDRLVELYFRSYVPAILTNPEYSPSVPEVLEDYRDVLSKAERSGTNLAKIQTYVYRGMGTIAAKDYPPSARIAAITILSELDSRPANTSAKTPPVPWGKTLPALVYLYEDEKNVDGVRAAALHGIHRHVNYGFQSLPANVKNKLGALMTALLDSEPPPGRSADAHAYLQRFAVDILDKLRKKGDPSLGQKLITISTEKSKPSLIALHSAQRIGEMGADMKGKVADASGVLDSWSRRALSVMQAEVERLEALDRPEPAAGQPPSPNIDSGGSGGAAAASGSTASRPRSGGGMDLSRLSAGRSSRPRTMDVDEDEDSRGSGLGSSLSGVRMGAGSADRNVKKERKPIPGQNQPAEVVASRRKINHSLQQLQIGVTGSPQPGMPSKTAGGLLASVAPQAQGEIVKWVERMKELTDEINSEYLTTRKEYVDALQLQIDQLREIVGEEPAAGDQRQGQAAAQPATDGEIEAPGAKPDADPLAPAP